MSDKESIKKAYEDGEGTFKALSEKYNISLGTIKSWAKQDKDKGQPWNKPIQPEDNKKVEVVKKVEDTVEKKVEVIEVKNLVISDGNRIAGLTEKQRLFVAEYLKDFNATRAYMKVYGSAKSTAQVEGCRFLKNPKVQAEIKCQTEVLFDSIGLTQQRILMEYAKIASADINDFLDFGQKEVPIMKDGKPVLDKQGNQIIKTVNYVDFKESSQVDGTLIQEIRQGKDGISIKLYDKQKAMDTLAKYMNIISGGIQVNIQQNSINVTLEDDEE